ncbi:MAG: winged helix-turn-helix domain-containing protein [Candidatus Bathyarchaeia archaeon]
MIELNFSQLGLSKRRSRLEIYVDILRIIEGGISKPTRIMFAANLSWKTLNEILRDLEERRLIERRTARGRKIFLITEEGRRALEAFENLFMGFANHDLTYMHRKLPGQNIQRIDK